jgi:hypothetical protein
LSSSPFGISQSRIACVSACGLIATHLILKYFCAS